MRFQPRHVQRAFAFFREQGIPLVNRATRWEVIDPESGDGFPPKLILAKAVEFARDNETKPGSGGDRGTNNALRAWSYEFLDKQNPSDDSVYSDLGDLGNLRKTTQKRLVDARLGQGTYRARLLSVWNGRCALTGAGFAPLLKASHIKPWSLSTNAERLDRYNGLLLAAHIDALFDSFAITFGDKGELIISKRVSIEIRKLCGLNDLLVIRLNAQNLEYMKFHRARFRSLE